MSLARWIAQKLTERFISITGGLFAVHVETAAALEEAECQDLLEKRARQFEAEGKPELAAALREKAARITSEAPASAAVTAVQYLQHTDLATGRALPAPSQQQDSSCNAGDDGDSADQRPVRRATRRPARTNKN